MRKALLLATALLAGCSTVSEVREAGETPPRVVENIRYTSAPPKNGHIMVGVYTYNDLTGQRQPSSTMASLSTAVTQGAENYVIDGLKEYSNGTWFRVLERRGLDNLIKERQLVRSSREAVSDENISPLPQMLYAGVLVEGGIIGYDSAVISGGNGFRIFGTGVTEKVTQHRVTVALRVVSVATTEVLISVIVEKEILSSAVNSNTIKFFDLDQKVVEIEGGMNENEAPSHAVKITIDKAIHEMVQEGLKKHIW